LLREASKAAGHHKFSLQFLLTEWEQVVDAWQLQSWEGYREVARLGRKTRLPEPQRAVLWTIFEQVRSGLARRNLITYSGLFSRLASTMEKSKHPPFEFAVLDEAQDLSISQLRFLAALWCQSFQCSLLCRRSRRTDLSATLLLERAGRRHPRAIPQVTRELPYLAPDPHTGGPAVGTGSI
jgi:hypothetical protein